MEFLQKMFDETVKNNFDFESIFEKVIKRKFDNLGIKLEKDEITEILSKLNSGNTSDFQINIDDDRVFSSKLLAEDIEDGKLTIDFNETDWNKAKSKLSSEIREIHKNTIKDTAIYLQKKYLRNKAKVLRDNRREAKIIKEEITDLWQKPIDSLEFFIYLVKEFGSEFNAHYGEIAFKKKDKVYEVLLGLFARSCQISSEVLILLKSGFPDGALARWRTLHEVAVVSTFIHKHGNEAAKRYISHECVEDYKGAKQYQNLCEITNQIPLSKAEFDEIEKDYLNVINQFGSEFKSDYGWASHFLTNKKPNFSDIEKDVNLDVCRPDYKLASHTVHSNPMGISVQLGRFPEHDNHLMMGPSIFGLDVAGRGTAQSLFKVIACLLFWKPNLDVAVYHKVLIAIENDVLSEFEIAGKLVEQEIASLV